MTREKRRSRHPPEDEQVLLHPEALGPEVAPGFVIEAPGPCGPLVRVAVQLGKLHELVLLERVVVFGLLPHARAVEHQALLEAEGTAGEKGPGLPPPSWRTLLPLLRTARGGTTPLSRPPAGKALSSTPARSTAGRGDLWRLAATICWFCSLSNKGEAPSAGVAAWGTRLFCPARGGGSGDRSRRIPSARQLSEDTY